MSRRLERSRGRCPLAVRAASNNGRSSPANFLRPKGKSSTMTAQGRRTELPHRSCRLLGEERGGGVPAERTGRGKRPPPRVAGKERRGPGPLGRRPKPADQVLVAQQGEVAPQVGGRLSETDLVEVDERDPVPGKDTVLRVHVAVQADVRVGGRFEAAQELGGERLGLVPDARARTRQQACRIGQARRLVTCEARDLRRRRERVERGECGAEQRRARDGLPVCEVDDPAAVNSLEHEHLSAPGALHRSGKREVGVIGLELPGQGSMDPAGAFAETLLVDLRVRGRASGELVQREHQRRLRLVREDAGVPAWPAQLARDGKRLAHEGLQGNELPVVRKRPEHGREERAHVSVSQAPRTTISPLSDCRSHAATPRTSRGPSSRRPRVERQPTQSLARPSGPVPRTSTTVAPSPPCTASDGGILPGASGTTSVVNVTSALPSTAMETTGAWYLTPYDSATHPASSRGVPARATTSARPGAQTIAFAGPAAISVRCQASAERWKRRS